MPKECTYDIILLTHSARADCGFWLVGTHSFSSVARGEGYSLSIGVSTKMQIKESTTF